MFRKRLTFLHFNSQTAATENKEQNTLGNITTIQFQNCGFMFWGLIWSRGYVDVDKLLEKYLWWGSFFWRSCRLGVCITLPRMCSLASSFQGFRSDLLLSSKRKFSSQKNILVVTANRCFRIFIPTKIIYSGSDIRVGLRKPKMSSTSSWSLVVLKLQRIPVISRYFTLQYIVKTAIFFSCSWDVFRILVNV